MASVSPFNLFQSARFKLTLFYLAIILALSLTLSFGTRWLAQHEFEHGNRMERRELRGIVIRTLGVDEFRPPERLYGYQNLQEEQLSAKLNTYVLMINLGALVLGGFASYMFAGWTLRPIQEAHEAQARFASDASHELRTPLTVMRAENEIFLRQKDFDKAEARELIESNLEEVNRLERLSANLLLMAEYEDSPLELSKVALKPIVEEAVQQLRKTAPNTKVTSQVVGKKIMGNRESLVQLLGIVLDNAAKYGGDKPVAITSEVVDEYVLLHIADQGKGISEEDLPYIFDRLYRGDKARSSVVPGHGLGLSLAHRIALANGSTISAANIEEGGAVFMVSLPLA